MDILIHPRKLQGELTVIPSKSLAHRYLICAAFAANPTKIICPDTNQDITATVNCLNALGAGIIRAEDGYVVNPITTLPHTALLPCRESGSTLRFLLPIVGALGVDTQFHMEGRLPQRPLSPLWEEMERMGCTLTRPSENTIRCQGRLRFGEYTIDGSISSQFISGLLFALHLMPADSRLTITGNLESRPYVDMTRHAIDLFGPSGGTSPGTITVEGDWSNGAFFLAANAMGNQIEITNLNPNSIQGDRVVTDLLQNLRNHCTISARDIPDLVPILSVVAAANQGAQFTHIRRLRLKESDRVAAIVDMIRNLGGKAEATENTLTIYGTGLQGGCVNSRNDHRIAMSAAIASTVCASPVTIQGAEAVQKSYPRFWEEFTRLGGKL